MRKNESGNFNESLTSIHKVITRNLPAHVQLRITNFYNMKNMYLTLCLLFGAWNLLQAQTAQLNPNQLTMKWNETTHDFGKIPKDKPVTYRFEVKNTGQSTLIISRVDASCGCTASEFSKEAIKPGKKGYVQATYNAAANGGFTKSLTVSTNASETPVTLIIKGEVIPDETVQEKQPGMN